jgi:hypothetical protein
LIIFEGLRRIEQSKIYVDLDGLKAILNEQIAGNYARLQALYRDQQVGATVSALAKQMKIRDEELRGELLLNFQQDSSEGLLASIMLRIWDEFAKNGHYGLDVYLSTRIRHGTIVGHLRSPLEGQNLLCQKEASGQYKDQAYWGDRLANHIDGNSDILQAALKNFSIRIDSDFDAIKSKWLKVRTSEGDGWFDFSAREHDLRIFEKIMRKSPDLSLSKFLDRSLLYLWRRLGLILRLVRRRFEYQIRGECKKHLLGLRQEVQTIEHFYYRAELDGSIVRATTALDLAFDKVSAWFTLSSSNQNPDYQLDLAVEIAQQTGINCFGRGTIDVRLTTTDTPLLNGGTLASLVDFFFILLETVARHARSPTGGATRVDVGVQCEGTLFTVSVRNDLPYHVDVELLRSRVLAMKQTLEDEEGEIQRLTREGGAGFHKLRKIIATDLNSRQMFDFKIVGDRGFLVTIIFDARSILS